ncbi:MAG TPA: hypothetical protein VMT32_20595 [Bryobacteraceae bacterium]|nr:hypothetical protein [Bryobacteraceae bacterium]
MRTAFLFMAALAAVSVAQNALTSSGPSYSAAGIVNSASNAPDALAPNAIATVYGTGLSYSTGSAFVSTDGNLPLDINQVHVYVGGIGVPLYYVSPTQINFVIPADLRPGDVDFFTTHDGLAGPHVKITVHDAGPALYPWGQRLIASTHADGSIITEDHPAHAGETVVVYGTGLGKTDPPLETGSISMVAAQIQLLSELQVLVAGAALDPHSVRYAGVTPETPGLYQVNLVLPKQVGKDPEIRIAIGSQISPAGMKLPVR